MIRSLLVINWLLCFNILVPFAAILHVPADFSSIQDAVSASLDGDTVLCAPGTYHESLLIEARSVVIASYFILGHDTSFVTSTIVDCDPNLQQSRAVTIHHSHSDSVKIIGLTLRDGFLDSDTYLLRGGGGVYALNSTVILESNLITNNTARWGAGVRFDSSEAIVLNNTITMNTALVSQGGLRTWVGRLICEGNQFVQNSGGGVYAGPASGILRNNVFIGDDNNHRYGAAHLTGASGLSIDSTWIIEGNTFYHNYGGHSGGLYVASSDSVVVSGNFFEDNRAIYEPNSYNFGFGGGLSVLGCNNVTINDNQFIRNTAEGNGGAIYIGSNAYIYHNIFLYNHSSTVSAIMALQYNTNTPDVYVIENLFVGNTREYGTGFLYPYRGVLETNNQAWMQVSGCDFLENYGSAISALPAGRGRIITNNYWGDPSGPFNPTLNPEGQGDTVSVGGFIPWSTEHFWAANVEPDTNLVDFGPVAEGETVNHTLLLTNTGVETLIVRGGFLGDPAFSLDLGADSLVLASDESAEVLLRFVAQDEESHLDTLRFDCNDPEAFRETVELRANVTGAVPGGSDPDNLPKKFELAPAQPNPFNPLTLIRVELPAASDLRVEVLNLLGQRAALLHDAPAKAGIHTITFDGSHLASGLYLVRATSTVHGTRAQKALLLK